MYERTTGAREPRKLTGKGQATRARIPEHTAEPICAKAVRAIERRTVPPRRRCGVDRGSTTAFRPRESLVPAVIARQAERILTLHRSEQLTCFDSLRSTGGRAPS
jgi:TetR/AcrR family transcriptional regulator, transcriptional repressor for nem operon